MFSCNGTSVVGRDIEINRLFKIRRWLVSGGIFSCRIYGLRDKNFLPKNAATFPIFGTLTKLVI